MSDYIKREDALNASKLVYIECIEKDDGGFLEADADNIPIVLKRDIMELPAADVVPRELYQRALSDVVTLSVERKHGKWLDVTTLDNEFICWVCSECRHGADFVYEPYNFCPHCGADMRGDSDV